MSINVNKALCGSLHSMGQIPTEILPAGTEWLPHSSCSLPVSTPSLSSLSEQVFQGCKHSVFHVHSSKYRAIPALRHSHKTNLKRSIMFLLSIWLCVERGWLWARLGHNHLPCTNKPEESKPTGALGVGKEKDFRVVAQSSGRHLDLWSDLWRNSGTKRRLDD